jgi:hypothetical protein
VIQKASSFDGAFFIARVKVKSFKNKGMPSESLNNNLNSAKVAKKDEFYTQYVDIQKEVEAYLEFDPDTFRGNVVYRRTRLNCPRKPIHHVLIAQTVAWGQAQQPTSKLARLSNTQ